MGHLKIIIDHERIEYTGPFNATDLFRAIDYFLYERGFDKKQDKDFEQNTPEGRFVEWQITPWKKVSDYVRHMIKIRVLCHNLVKADVAYDGERAKVDSGKVTVIIDAFIESDYDSKWEDNPVFHFLRTIYDYFVFKAYTERFEQRLVHDTNQLHSHIEKFFNMCGSYKLISRYAP